MSSEPYPRVLGHLGVAVDDIDAAFEWYQDVLGFTPVMEPDDVQAGEGHFGRLAEDAVGHDFGTMRIAHLATGNHVGVELFEFDGTEGKAETNPVDPGISHICVQDPNIEDLAETIAETGGEIRSSGVWDIFPDTPDYNMVYCEDPWGNIVEIHSRGYEHMHCNMEY